MNQPLVYIVIVNSDFSRLSDPPVQDVCSSLGLVSLEDSGSARFFRVAEGLTGALISPPRSCMGKRLTPALVGLPRSSGRHKGLPKLLLTH